MQGRVPTDTNSSTIPYVAFCLLKIRFIDIISSLESENNAWLEKGKGKVVKLLIERSGLKAIVSLLLPLDIHA